MKQIHGYHKGECDPKEGRQLTLCGREIYQFNRYTVNIPSLTDWTTIGLTCSSCLARLVNARTHKPTKRTG